jgi:hypothetical protein
VEIQTILAAISKCSFDLHQLGTEFKESEKLSAFTADGSTAPRTPG